MMRVKEATENLDTPELSPELEAVMDELLSRFHEVTVPQSWTHDQRATVWLENYMDLRQKIHERNMKAAREELYELQRKMFELERKGNEAKLQANEAELQANEAKRKADEAERKVIQAEQRAAAGKLIREEKEQLVEELTQLLESLKASRA